MVRKDVSGRCRSGHSCSRPSALSLPIRPVWKVFLPGHQGFRIGLDYLIVENSVAEYTDFTYWRGGEDRGTRVPEDFEPAVIRMDYRLADLKTPCATMAQHFGARWRAGARTRRNCRRLLLLCGRRLASAYVCGIREGEGAASAMRTAAQVVEVRRDEPDLIDRIAYALPEEMRAKLLPRDAALPFPSGKR